MAQRTVAVIGGGPAGLMAAETLARAGVAVTVYDSMANPGRKFLLAGRGGLNLTHSEPLAAMLPRYGAAAAHLRPAIEAFPPEALRAWCDGLNQPTFVGTSGRIFPRTLKASPLLRAWLRRLGELGVRLQSGWRWTGWNPDGTLAFAAKDGQAFGARADTTVLALGGGSWPKLGSDGSWVPMLASRGVCISPLGPANCGVKIAWSELFGTRFAGQPLKRIAISIANRTVRGEAMVTAAGLEGGAVYELGPVIRGELETGRTCRLTLDLRPDFTTNELTSRLARARGKQSLANHLRKAAGLPPVAIALLREGHADLPGEATGLAQAIKSAPVTVTGLAPIERAISTAGGIAWQEIDARYMLRKLPGMFAAGEMLDWEAPTGGYLLQACFSTGVAAAQGALTYLV